MIIWWSIYKWKLEVEVEELIFQSAIECQYQGQNPIAPLWLQILDLFIGFVVLPHWPVSEGEQWLRNNNN